MAESATRRATYADLEAVPPHLVAEIVFGVLVTHPRPTGRHSHSHFRLGSVLGPPFDEAIGGPGGWRFLTEPELHLGQGVVVPELAGWRAERIPAPPSPDPLMDAKIRLVPDWVCEVLSLSTEKYDRGNKRALYAEAGIGHLWLVDPRVQILEAFVLVAGRWTLDGTYTGSVATRAAPFEVVQFDLGRIWPPSRDSQTNAREGGN